MWGPALHFSFSAVFFFLSAASGFVCVSNCVTGENRVPPTGGKARVPTGSLGVLPLTLLSGRLIVLPFSRFFLFPPSNVPRNFLCRGVSLVDCLARFVWNCGWPPLFPVSCVSVVRGFCLYFFLLLVFVRGPFSVASMEETSSCWLRTDTNLDGRKFSSEWKNVCRLLVRASLARI